MATGNSRKGLQGLAAKIRNSYKVNAARAAVRDFFRPVISAQRRMTLPGKVARRSPLWLHFGCGEVADARFVNVDARPFRHVDYITKSPSMPAIPAGRAQLIYACHVFEHISYHKGQRETLLRWREMLQPGGRLMLSVPDFEKIIALREERGFEAIQPALMGGQDYPGNFHYALFTQDHLRKLLLQAGFTAVETWHAKDQENWPRDWSWDEAVSLNLVATKT